MRVWRLVVVDLSGVAIDDGRVLRSDDSGVGARTAVHAAALATAIAGGRVRATPGAHRAFAALRARGLRVCLATETAPVLANLAVAALGLRSAVDLVVAPGPGVRAFPHPDLVLAAAERLGVARLKDVVVVGGGPHCLAAGRRAGAGALVGVAASAEDRFRLAAAPHTHLVAGIGDVPGLVPVPETRRLRIVS